MKRIISLFLSLVLAVASPAQWLPVLTGSVENGVSIPLTAIAANGYDGTYDGTPPTFNPVGDPQTFTVTRQGFDATGASITVNDTVTLMSRVRQAYPNQASLTADTVVASNFFYGPDTVSGVTNNSTRAYPLPGALWINRDLEVITSNSHTLRLAVSHAHARNGRPVAAVKFIMTDGTNTVETIDTTTEYVSWTASGLGAPVFEQVMNTSTLNQGATITVDAIIYPWVGEEFQLSVDADTYPSPNLTTLRMLCNRTGALATYYAYVDSSSNIAGTFTSGSFADGVTVTQTTSGATARVVGAQSSGSFLKVCTITGTPDSSNTWTNGGSTFTPSATPTANGNNGTGVVSTTAGTAAASPYAALSNAAAAIKTARNGAGVGNNTDLGVVRLVESDYVFSSISASNTTTWPVTIEAADPAKKTTTRLIAAAGASTTNSIPQQVVFRYITLCRGSSDNFVMLDQNSASNVYTSTVAFENCGFSLNGFDTYNAFIYKCSRVWFINCDGDDVGQAGTVSSNKTAISIGSTVGCSTGTAIYHAIACRASGYTFKPSSAVRVASAGNFLGWCFVSNGTTANPIVDTDNNAIGARGFFVPGTVIESWGTATSTALKLLADGNTNNGQNIVVQSVTLVGERLNALYIEGSTNHIKSGYFSYNLFEEQNIKGDLFASQTVDGNWAARYKVGWSYNAVRRGSASSDTYSPSGWLGDIAALGEVTGTDASPLTVNFVNDKSNYGSDDGGGDYTPGVGHALPLIPAGWAPYSHDLYGTPIPNDGTAVVGAVQIP